MIDMDKLHNNKSCRDWDSENYYFVICSSRSNSNNNKTYNSKQLLCNYDVIEENIVSPAVSYDVKL